MNAIACIKHSPFALASLALVHLAPAAITPGSLAVVGFNADGSDDFALVVYEDIAADETVFFRDDEWNGGFNTGEAEFTWTTPALTAGTVVVFSSIGDSAIADVNLGTISFTRGSSMNLSGSGEAIWIYQGTSGNPIQFISAFGSGMDQFDGTAGSLDGTGLTLGLSATALPGSTPDGAIYIGPRSGLASFEEYQPLVGEGDTYWDFFASDGTQALPFDTTSFTVAAIPEAEQMPLLCALTAATLCLVRRARARKRPLVQA